MFALLKNDLRFNIVWTTKKCSYFESLFKNSNTVWELQKMLVFLNFCFKFRKMFWCSIFFKMVQKFQKTFMFFNSYSIFQKMLVIFSKFQTISRIPNSKIVLEFSKKCSHVEKNLKNLFAFQ